LADSGVSGLSLRMIERPDIRYCFGPLGSRDFSPEI
jgi:hypothetical protein